jgi:hypothetical protein
MSVPMPPSCSIIKYGDTLKYLFTVEMVGTSGAATMIFFKKKQFVIPLAFENIISTLDFSKSS